MTDEELSRALTEAFDAHVRQTERLCREDAAAPANAEAGPEAEGPAVPASGTKPVAVKSVPVRRARLRALIAAALALCVLGGAFLLLWQSIGKEPVTTPTTEPHTPEPTAESSVPTEPAVSTEPTEYPETPEAADTIVCHTGIPGSADLYGSRTDAQRGTIAALIDDYDVMTTDRQGRWVVNASVCEAMETEENEDGSRTVTVVLREGLRYNNGEPITAVDFLVNALLDFSPWMAQKDSHDFEQIAACFAGAQAYMNGETDTISGLRLIDDRSYSVTIPAEAWNYFSLANLSLRPVRAELFGAEAEVEGETVRLRYLSADGPDLIRGRTTLEGRVCAGPYLVESYDPETDRTVLRRNEYYAGNFEGQKPAVETVVVEFYGTERSYEALPEEEINYFPCFTDGDMIDLYLRYADAGELTAASYQRAGFGYLLFQCDMGPTQFRAVRQAISCFIDRETFAKEFCQGYGTVLHGPYLTSRWEYLENAGELEEKLDAYAYDPARAVALLEEDGWVLAEDGSPYVSGLRYKAVTPEEAGSDPLTVELPDGRLLMPLLIDQMVAEGGSVNDATDPYLSDNQAMIDAGMRVCSYSLPFSDLLSCLYREDWTLEEGAVLFNYVDESMQLRQYVGPSRLALTRLAVNLTTRYDYSADFIEEYTEFHYDCESTLAELARQMDQARDDAEYAALWKDFILEWNRELPYIPLYQNIFYDFMDPRIHGLSPDADWPFARAVLYATIE